MMALVVNKALAEPFRWTYQRNRLRGAHAYPAIVESPNMYEDRHSMKPPQTVPSVLSRRAHKRIRVQIPIKLTWNSSHEPILAMGQDISWGGAHFSVPKLFPDETESVLIALPWANRNHVPISASVLRIGRPQDDHDLVAVRFSSLLPQDELRLRKLLTMLGDSNSTTNGGESNNLFQELDLSVCDADEFLHILSQITTGRYTLFVSGPYSVGQSIGLSLEGPNGAAAIRLRARVIKVEPLDGDISARTGVHSLTLAFEHPPASLESLFNSYAQRRSANGYQVRRGPSLLNVGGTVRPAATNVRCAIEVDHPEFLHRLTVTWGDISTFEALFRDLTIGDIGQSGGLSLDVWEELNFLRNLHDQAYCQPTGVNTSSANPVKNPRAGAASTRGWIGRKLFGA